MKESELRSTSAIILFKSLWMEEGTEASISQSARMVSSEWWALGSAKPRASPLLTLEVQHTLHSTLAAFLWGRGGTDWTNWEIICSRNTNSIKNSAPLCQGGTIHLYFFWIPRPEEFSGGTLFQRLATASKRGLNIFLLKKKKRFRPHSLTMSEPLFLPEWQLVLKSISTWLIVVFYAISSEDSF